MRMLRCVSVFTCLFLLTTLVQGSELPIPRGSARGLPPGAASEAPKQHSGSATDPRPGGSTGTSLRSAARRPPRPKGAVADRRSVPALGPPSVRPQRRLTNVKTRKSERPRRGFHAKTSQELPAERSATSRVYQNDDGS